MRNFVRRAFPMKVLLVTAVLFAVGFTSITLYQKPEKTKAEMIERGKYLVTVADCNGCHTPLKLTAQGPVSDSSRFLSGYPASLPVPKVPTEVLGPGKWDGLFSSGNAFAGAWGVSFPRNLTPDIATGLGSWTDEMFIKALRTGKDMGEGRDILPPMPWESFGQITDADLKAIFAYLRTLTPVENPVPDPVSPTGERLPTGKGGKLPEK
jgi:mono/diheme cytochrome c family protein